MTAARAWGRSPTTVSGSATPTCGCGSRRTARPRGDEPVWGYAKDLRSRMTQWDQAERLGARRRRRRRPGRGSDDRRRQGRHRHQGRPDRRRRAGRQSRDQRWHRPAHRAAHPADHGLRADRDARRRRQPRPRDHAPLAAGRALGRRDHADHRRLRGAAVGHGADAPGTRGLAGERWASRPAPARKADAPLDALLAPGVTGFKIHEDYGAYPELIDHVLRYADARTSRSASTPTASTSRRSSRTPSPRSAAGRSTPTTSRGPAAATSPTCSGWSASRT